MSIERRGLGLGILVACLVGMVAVMTLVQDARFVWLLLLPLLTGAWVALALVLKGVWLGLVLNSRDLASLSRVQWLAWITVILASLLTFSVHGTSEAGAPPWEVPVPPELAGALGISGISAITAQGALSRKAKRDLPTAEKERRAKVLAEQYRKEYLDDPRVQEEIAKRPALSRNQQLTQSEETRIIKPVAAMDAAGELYRNQSPYEARLTDIFEGDDYGNVDSTDFAKVQMFMFTLVALVLYAVAVWRALGEGAGMMPGVPSGLLQFLGLSHLGYVGSKLQSH